MKPSSRFGGVASPRGRSSGARGTASPRKKLGSLLAFALGVAALGPFGCHTARFPVCEKDDDCAKEKTAKLCYDLRCVQCRYDGDCGDGYCERRTGTCEILGGVARDDAPPPEGSAAPSASASAPAP